MNSQAITQIRSTGDTRLMRNLFSIFALAAIFLFPSVALRAQDNASMTGVVTDSTGALLPDTVVVLKNPGTGVTFTQTTKANGSYRFTNVPPDHGYTATFTHTGFVAAVVQNLALEVGSTRTQDARLTVGAAEEVEVSGSGNEVTINTTDATVGNNIDPALLSDLPV